MENKTTIVEQKFKRFTKIITLVGKDVSSIVKLYPDGSKKIKITMCKTCFHPVAGAEYATKPGETLTLNCSHCTTPL